MDQNEIAAIVGYVLFVISEILGLSSTSGNGILHTVFLGLQNFQKGAESVSTSDQAILASINGSQYKEQIEELVSVVVANDDPTAITNLVNLAKLK